MTRKTFSAIPNKTLVLLTVGPLMLVSSVLLPTDFLCGMAQGSGIVMAVYAVVQLRRALDGSQAPG
ncbi:hypothetical protein [Streptomyces sp. x-19]|uniref:hypothetical protein n=1 Tax=Streptomyces sp. x-19 TaxID=2789280 RepID=UPI00397F1B03